ncbi:hypothetical protein [Streptomyces mirabilis]|uniref:Uncharacterized protein n=1 Tax=Streptomyces mirabilis TaxID=68239 RepID=A0ABU3UXU2_9ACTN|nr:hypothetical protein [Streptomyces mirabilis]MDU8998730.1 hypothetical protein [Streptomyces mirabilis]
MHPLHDPASAGTWAVHNIQQLGDHPMASSKKGDLMAEALVRTDRQANVGELASPERKDFGRAVGTCGELRQGVVDDTDLMITFPFERLPYTCRKRAILRDAYDQAIAGLSSGDLCDIGQAATASARVNQRRHPKPFLDLLHRTAFRHGGCGVSVAHRV